MAAFRPIVWADAVAARQKTNVSFRINLPIAISAGSVDLVGSWDGFSNAMPLEQDRRVGRDVWKGVYSRGGGLEMGSEHWYYFILDRKYSIPDPHSSPSSLVIDHRSGNQVSVLYVPIEQQQQQLPEPAATTTGGGGADVFAAFDDGCATFSAAPREVGKGLGRSGFRARLRARKSMGALLGRVHAPDPDPKNTGDHRERKRRRGWGLSVSTAFLRRSSYKEPERQETGRNEEAIRDIAGYLRNNVETGHRSFAYPVPTSVPSSLYSSEDRIEQSPDMCTSFYSSEDEENEDEITTPPDDTMSELQQTQSYPKYYNFDELMKSGGAYAGDILVAAEGADVRPLEYLREQVAREVKWRDEIVDELGYLGSVVV